MFDGTIGEWDTEPVNLELNTVYKLFRCKNYPVPIINKYDFLKELQQLVEIGVLTLVQQFQHGTYIFITPKK